MRLKITLLFILIPLFSGYVIAVDNDIKEFSIISDDVRSVKVVFDKKWPTKLEIQLSTNKAHELSALTRENVLRKVRIIIEGQVVGEPEIRDEVSFLEIVPKDTEEAIRIAKQLTKKNEAPNK